MLKPLPRMRMFAGPNGSGKTTVMRNLGRPPEWFGIYINPDDIERSIQKSGQFSLDWTGFSTNTQELRDYFRNSEFLIAQGRATASLAITVEHNTADFRSIEFDSYYASVLSDFLRRKALAARISFTFETVMSAGDKVDLLKLAQEAGYRTYLYYVATENPEINVDRVNYRVQYQQEHSVPEDKIRSRYERSLALLPRAIRYSNRAFFFDTSEDSPWYFAKSTDGLELELTGDEMPVWFNSIWDLF